MQEHRASPCQHRHKVRTTGVTPAGYSTAVVHWMFTLLHASGASQTGRMDEAWILVEREPHTDIGDDHVYWPAVGQE